jgi:adenylate cyclase
MSDPSEPPASNPTRELAAIMFSDIAGYTLLMGRDERKALRAIAEHREHLRALLPRFNGRMIGEIGDGTLTSFHSAVDAVACARALQAEIQNDPELRLRIGIHVGDVVFTNHTALGDGVNVASRIHALTDPGGICISERVYDDIRNKPEIQVRDLGEKRLKNVERPIRVYALATAAAARGPLSRTGAAKRRAMLAGAGALLAAGLICVLVLWRWSAPTSVSSGPAAPRAIRSIAVLPLENLSGDPNQTYFADGMTDELITDLATISALRVISRTSVMQFKGEHRKPLPEIAKALNVDAIVEGSVMRAGDKVRITAQLIDAPADRHLWAKSYERDSHDVLAMQDEVALAIAREINVRLTPGEQARFASARPVNPQAHEAYLKGRYFLSGYSLERVGKAIAQFELAIKLDRNFAPAYAGLADAYGYEEDWYVPATEVMPKAKAAADKALELDDNLAEAHTALAGVLGWYEFDWPAAESEYQRAILLNSSFAEAHHGYGLLLLYQGRLDKSLAEMRRAAELDPLAATIVADMGLPLTLQRNYETAAAEARKASELDPNSPYVQALPGWIRIQAGKAEEAIPYYEKASVPGAPPLVTAFLGFAYAVSGQRSKAQEVLADLDQMSRSRFVSPWCGAIVYLGLGDKQRALDGLEKAYEVRSQQLAMIKVDKIYDSLRSEPRFIALLKKVGLAT